MYADLGEVLPRLGLRRTVPRLLILDILREQATHLSALRLHTLVSSLCETINVSTVYRNVSVMTRRGVLHSIDHAGETLFGLAVAPHHHLICRRCGTLVELPADHLSEAAAAVMACSGFAMDADGQVLSGHCRRCRHA
ncbi:transcriptional repressor [Nonomuraea fuscirosea]|uniref:Fur family transcriptional regulator n=1 Tax=Nonomuraea fuscirosea TaxID=1291556 RepID=UPI002DD7DBC7|nr:transcriptional repressor [Nonomuraea fuscirosea]WSA56805.1 transcriptional repressor [Nonomuraea fuscirosea]